ncbi:unnamed protein product [Acanthoscelides obtectus]|uniref:U3 small nucleolar ribonucleoprotein protein MPP10 n=1 Tax=Acanthoscelides obtectus TaxID=200917 RepID=A0A9P0PIY7_ACAOB|nr:unnamed protein product [Acanthoscelides obtectus]CAK1666227.1 U3 small nucleolar ribonucleoprotein protein MPP10 [Acanthoscelides obtectus]
MCEQNSKLDFFLDDFKKLTVKPDVFVNPDVSLQTTIKLNLKETYDFSKSQEIKVTHSKALPELLVKNFDLEQIWQQIELQNDTVLMRVLKPISKLLVNKESLVFPNLDVKDKIDDEDNTKEDSDKDMDGTNEELLVSENDESGDEEEVNNSDDNHSDIDEIELKKPKKKSSVEDGFLDLEEMEKFVRNAEKNLEPDSGNDTDGSESEEGSIDFFKDDDEDEEKVKQAKFKDFFVAKDNGTKEIKKNKFLDDMDDDDLEDEQRKSTLEQREERLNRKIEEIEQSAVGEKYWPLKGEVKADDRPQNSLLEEVVEFDLISRPAPVITEKTTVQLEDIIKQRIKDKAFDDVERKVKLVETPLELRKKVLLDQEKSKHSLAQIYEKEYLNQQAALDPNAEDKEEEEPAIHKQVKAAMKELFSKLDALSNFHFTPKPAKPELKIVSHLPAISMEEVAPVTASEATLLAPEEIRNKSKGDLIGKSERTSTDKNRERRKKKKKQKEHLKQIAKNKSPNVQKLEKKRSNLKKVMKARNVEKMDEKLNPKAIRSSKAFFTQLQDEVKTHISEKVKKKRKSSQKPQFDSKKIKL